MKTITYDETQPSQQAGEARDTALDFEFLDFGTGECRTDRLLDVSGVDPATQRDDANMDRFYIPVHPDWEIQTNGKGSSFRIANRKTGDRWLVMDSQLHGMLEQMARDIHAAMQNGKSEDARDAARYRWLRDTELLDDVVEILTYQHGEEADAAIDRAMQKGGCNNNCNQGRNCTCNGQQ